MVAELSLRLAGSPDAPAEARTALARAHPELPPELMQRVCLLASELVSNAVKHGAAESVSMRFEVADDGPGFDFAAPQPDPTGVGGWGLHLVDEFSSRWGVVHGNGARVWFEIDRE